ncbi:phytanoyl-CoA dioxygenase family protein [Mucilaginibacter sp. JRF]|uniref:phytanoyl-CoA dioxygenase family protein n=1 Tax=Mucilaginibacter sp. JRF TaxID=2780088 RepID=UPI00187E2480|nr:phytanoyl-CoA dioxygenase family protein [Mucilaginibacter sp. JRF]MBE9586421.1 phytanoyl-CoA dioxygenase family protein [Mucilaginibacter sp. JRF]
MNSNITQAQVDFYQEQGYIIIEDFLSAEELAHWKAVVQEALAERKGQKMPGKSVKLGDDDGINKDAEYHNKVFEQSINLWQTNEKVKELMFDARIGEMAAKLAGVDGIRIWHDQALFKKPWANPTSWHLDTPFWSFTDKRALSIWVALDDATLENGCLFFIPGSHLGTGFENPGIGKNMDAIFTFYPQFQTSRTVAAPMKAGSCSFHNGLTIHGAHANMTAGLRRAMTCAYMPDGNVYNGIANVLPQSYLDTLQIGDLLNNEAQNPLIYKEV